jgi:RHS repeat-associated protein
MCMVRPRWAVLGAAALFIGTALCSPAAFAQGNFTPIPGGGSGGGGGGSLGDLLGSGGSSGVGGGGTAAMCTPSAAGATCGGAGPASQGNTSGVNTGAGNPINLTNGNKHVVEVDLPALPGELGLEIVRHYNSAQRFVVGQLGVGWRLSYETDLYVVGQTLQILQADGTRLIFDIDPRQPGRCGAADPAQGWVQIEEQPRGAVQYIWHWTHGEHAGRALHFDARGKLTRISAASGAVLSLQRGPKGELLAVTDPQGRSLRFNHGGRTQARAAQDARDQVVFTGVQSIDSPVGRFAYRHDGARLTQVSLPTQVDRSQNAHALANRVHSSSGITRQYHHEDERHPQALTGISVLGTGSDGQTLQQRLASYRYNERGQATHSVRGEWPASGNSGPEQVQVDILQPALPTRQGQALLTNSLGQQTLYTHRIIGGQYRLVQAVGAGCASCGPVNRRWGYDSVGRLIEQTALSPVAVINGQPQGNPQALLTLRHTLDAHGRSLRIERIGYRNGQAQAPELIERREHTDARWVDKPTLIARPSVVAGREHRIALSYNDAGQVTELKETGWSPLDAQGALATSPQQATPIERTTRYVHTRLNGVSVLTQVDGPLPNGPGNSPADSDITALQWDERGRHIQTVHSPGGRSNTLAYQDDSGLIERVVNEAGFATEWAYNPQLQVLRIRSQGPGWTQPQVQSFQYNALGQRVQGFEGDVHAVAQGREDADQEARPTERMEYDSQGRLLWRASALGVLQTWQYDSEGQPLQIARHSARMAQVIDLTHDEPGRLRHTGGNAARWPQAFIDDFGRTVLTRSTDRGDIRRNFDEADRLVAMTDAVGHRAEYAHDAQGRVLKQRITDARTGEVSTTEWRYSVRHLREVIHPTQRERFETDARGLRTARIVTLSSPQGELTSVIRYEHDERGQLIASTLPDGSRLVYERNGQRQVVALKRQTIQTPWLRWLEQEQTLAQDFERDLVGLRGYTSGNGIEARFERSASGDLARIVYRHTQARPTVQARNGQGSTTTLMGQSTQETIERLLGIRSAHASTASNEPLGEADKRTLPGEEQQRTLPGALGLPHDPQALMDHRYLWSPQGLLLHSQQRAGSTSEQHQHSHAYNSAGELVASVRASLQDGAQEQAQEQAVWRYAYDAQQRRVLSQQGVASQSDTTRHTERSQFQSGSHRLNRGAQPTTYNANGQPKRVGRREYVWDALGRLIEVREESKPLAQYRYDHRGLRIGNQVGQQTTHTLHDESRQPLAELDAQGRITRQYVWLADIPLAVIDSPADSPRRLALAEQGIEQVLSDIRRAVQSWFNEHAGIAWLHTNHLGAPEAATNAQGQLIWRASYAPFGAATVLPPLPTGERAGVRGEPAPAFTLHLRLPGQVWDEETGLHYNRQRYYDPELGQYLTPDPLGTPDGPNPYAYVAFNPLVFIDPDGLILFAFDGTGNDESDPNTISNVVRFRDLYASDEGLAFYITGPGTEDPRSGIQHPWHLGGNPADTVASFTGKERVAFLINDLQRLADDTPDETVLDIDVVGFSRGAAQARDFANQVANATRDGWYAYSDTEGVTQCQRVNLRFMGLFDTVLSVHRGSYNLGIPDAFSHVAHAVAMNEYRNLFPLESIAQGQFSATPVAGQVRIERGFLGAHSDIGGGFADGDLAKVALVWMVNQATAAGVQMDALTSEQTTIIANPVLHDSSSNLHANTGPAPTSTSEDRVIRFRGGTAPRQRTALVGTGTGYQDTAPYITYSANPRGNVAGTVDMNGYLQWLNQNGNGINMTVQ